MTDEQFPPLQEFIKKQWKTLAHFALELNEEDVLFLEGEGTLFLQRNVQEHNLKDIYNFFMINGKLYASASKERLSDNKPVFDGVYQFKDELLKSTTFRQAQERHFSTRYRPLGTRIRIECKPYDYQTEHKLLFSKFSKVDLLYSHHLVSHSDGSCSLKCQTYPSLGQAVTWQTMVDKVDKRTELFIQSKKNK